MVESGSRARVQGTRDETEKTRKNKWGVTVFITGMMLLVSSGPVMPIEKPCRM